MSWGPNNISIGTAKDSVSATTERSGATKPCQLTRHGEQGDWFRRENQASSPAMENLHAFRHENHKRRFQIFSGKIFHERSTFAYWLCRLYMVRKRFIQYWKPSPLSDKDGPASETNHTFSGGVFTFKRGFGVSSRLLCSTYLWPLASRCHQALPPTRPPCAPRTFRSNLPSSHCESLVSSLRDSSDATHRRRAEIARDDALISLPVYVNSRKTK